MKLQKRSWLADAALALGLVNAAANHAGQSWGWLGRRRSDQRAALSMLAVGGLLGGRLRRGGLLAAALVQPVLAQLRTLTSATRMPQGVAVRIPRAADGWTPGRWFVPARPAVGAVVFVHGAGADKDFFTWRIVATLLAQELAVLTIDLDGHGASPLVLELPEVTQSVMAAVRWLAPQHARVAVAGLSLGGCVAARAVADGLPVTALAVIAAPLELKLSQVPYRRAELRGLLRRAVWSWDDQVTAWHMARMWRRAAPARVRLSTAATIRQLDLAGALRAIATPVLLLYATGDLIAPVAPLLAEASPHQLHIEPGASHLSLTLEARPLAVLAYWLRTQLQSG